MNKNTLWTIIVIALIIILGVWIFTSKKTDIKGGSANTSVSTDTSGVVNTATSTDTNATTTAPASIKEFTVTGKNFSFTPSTLSVHKGDTVKITFKNTGGMHDLRIDEFNVSTKVIQGGATDSIQFVADKTGSFEYYCSVGEHRAMGMRGTLTVK